MVLRWVAAVAIPIQRLGRCRLGACRTQPDRFAERPAERVEQGQVDAAPGRGLGDLGANHSVGALPSHFSRNETRSGSDGNDWPTSAGRITSRSRAKASSRCSPET
jgi:hypothetical protein